MTNEPSKHSPMPIARFHSGWQSRWVEEQDGGSGTGDGDGRGVTVTTSRCRHWCHYELIWTIYEPISPANNWLGMCLAATTVVACLFVNWIIIWYPTLGLPNSLAHHRHLGVPIAPAYITDWSGHINLTLATQLARLQSPPFGIALATVTVNVTGAATATVTVEQPPKSDSRHSKMYINSSHCSWPSCEIMRWVEEGYGRHKSLGEYSNLTCYVFLNIFTTVGQKLDELLCKMKDVYLFF